ncbi:MAG: hypothetical protein OEM81_01550 [Acidimicrobiia bacterium]|nr:hypothetical protein [Acidimicrobiia bacterium]
MMRRIAAALIVVLELLLPRCAMATTDVDVEHLLTEASAYEGQTISGVGELIGDYGFRPDGWTWTQLNSDSYTTAPLLEDGDLSGSNVGIGIRAPASLIQDLDPPGDYHHRGPLVRATGTWKYHDQDRGGETYLEVVTIEVLELGKRFDESADPIVAAAGVFLVLVAMWLGYRSRLRSAD